MATKNVEMLVTQQGAEDGINVHTYEKGEVYAMEESLAAVFIKEEWAKATTKKPKVEEDEGGE